jgi:hypothetical protein
MREDEVGCKPLAREACAEVRHLLPVPDGGLGGDEERMRRRRRGHLVADPAGAGLRIVRAPAEAQHAVRAVTDKRRDEMPELPGHVLVDKENVQPAARPAGETSGQPKQWFAYVGDCTEDCCVCERFINLSTIILHFHPLASVPF